MVEHQPSKLDVAGSTPAARSNSGREILLRVEAPNFCAGAVYRFGEDSIDCIETAPILRRWLAGKSLAEAMKILGRKERDGWKVSYSNGQVWRRN
jgi:hypothetical protein